MVSISEAQPGVRHDEMDTPPPVETAPDVQIHELSEHASAHVEVYHHPELNMSGSVVNFGIEITQPELVRLITNAYGEHQSGDTGFKRVFRTSTATSEQQAVEDEYAAAGHALDAVLAANGWEPKDVEGIFVGSGTPPVADYAQLIADRFGLVHADIQHSAYLACNSGGYELLRAMHYPGKRVVVLGIEGMTRLTTGFQPDKVDLVSSYVFSNAVAAWAGIPGESLTLLPGMKENGAVPDDKAALPAIMTYAHPADVLFTEGDRITSIQLPDPGPGKAIAMKAGDTAMLFTQAMIPAVARSYEQYAAVHGKENLQFAVMHYANPIIADGILKRLDKRHGIAVGLPLAITDGNSSASNTLKMHARAIGMMQPGKDIAVVSFGAGMSWTIFYARVGPYAA